MMSELEYEVALDKMRTRIETLEAALKPFADAGRSYGYHRDVTEEHFRAAAEAMKEAM